MVVENNDPCSSLFFYCSTKVLTLGAVIFEIVVSCRDNMQLDETAHTDATHFAADTCWPSVATPGNGHRNKRSFHDLRSFGHFSINAGSSNVKRAHRFMINEASSEGRDHEMLLRSCSLSAATTLQSSPTNTAHVGLAGGTLPLHYGSTSVHNDHGCGDDDDICFGSRLTDIALSSVITSTKVPSPSLPPALAAPTVTGTTTACTRPAVYVNTGVYHHVILKH